MAKISAAGPPARSSKAEPRLYFARTSEIPERMRGLLDHLLLCSAVLIFCGPVLWLLSSALHPNAVLGNWQSLTSQLSTEANGPDLDRMLWVTLVLATSISVLTTLCSFLAAFVLTYFQRPLLGFAFWLSIATLYFPVEARMLQTFDVIAAVGLTSSFAGLTLPVLQLGLGTLFFRQHLKGLPPALFEAARLDSAGPLRALCDIALPLSLSSVATVALVTFILGWNQYLWPLMASVDDRHWTLVRGLERIRSGSGAGLLLAAMALIPPLLLILVFRKFLRLRQ